ncbi:MAG: D-glycero-alpha-D-manno-heptose-1,7-bisphosphate 7-phosphatase [Oscillochloridaceae bacterium umkhey_bin13]
MQALFLDRDGVINENRHDYVKSWQELQPISGVFEALRCLTQAGWPIFVVTNQAAINHGRLSEVELVEIHKRLQALALRHGGVINDFRYCPHRPDEGCACRKPGSAMLTCLAQQYGLDLTRSYLIGDALTDIAAGKAVGCQTILVRTGRGKEQLDLPAFAHWRPDYVATDLLAATDWILDPANRSELARDITRMRYAR